MPSKKLVAIIIVAILALGIGYVVTWGYVHKDPSGSYDYDISYADSFTTEQGVEVTPTVGKTFVIANVVVKNDNFSNGISTNVLMLAWTLTLDRMTFELDPINTALHPDYNELTINEGRTWGYTVVFQVPDESVGKRDLSLSYHYTSLTEKLDLVYDPDLRLRIG